MHLQPLRGTQSSKQGIWKGSHLLKKGIRKRHLLCQKWYIKEYGVGSQGGAYSYETLLSTPRTQTCFHCSGYRFKRTKLSLFDLNLFINIEVMYSAPSVMFSVFSFCLFCFCFFGKGSSCFNLEWVNKSFSYIAAMLWNFLTAKILLPCCETSWPQK